MKRTSMRYFALLAGILTVLLAACSKNNDDFNVQEQFIKETAAIEAYLKTNNLSAERDTTTGIYYNIQNPGNGKDSITSPYAKVKVLYTGRLLSNGTVFDSTTTEPREFAYDQLISGWQLALLEITKGGKLRMYLPSWYAYGTRSLAGIPANSTLIFDMELLDITYPQ
ncbi:FKBP-type peptidyl-prolyl cis-trans isomerase [Chitinophaga tropicalis]|uniref:Peptidyl-prolyl cis-trans isomerase n=1 Tax=Chitinophaga tropicalis TaxID=2683588 RepID=A0A7K1U7V6_9BACT|nr:FKBP-type peptidyl-prolyl cis-trans isomerase [Chitinophaga tropicalis]MVT10447.1 peptidylprolyl isomerase [Chitinophaga tropicalis]